MQGQVTAGREGGWTVGSDQHTPPQQQAAAAGAAAAHRMEPYCDESLALTWLRK